MTQTLKYMCIIVLVVAIYIAIPGLFAEILGHLKVNHPNGKTPLGEIGLYWVGFGLQWLVVSMGCYYCVNRFKPKGPVQVTIGSHQRATYSIPPKLGAIAIILFIALLPRLMMIHMNTPQLSDDIWRYIFDGQQLGVYHQNPYAHPPIEMGAGADGGIQNVAINHAHLVTLYQPTSQWVFAFFAQSSRWIDQALSWMHEVPGITSYHFQSHIFRYGFVLFDLGIILMLCLKLMRLNRSLGWVLLYAWHPLAISEVGHGGHQDVIGIAWLLMTLWLLDGARQGGQPKPPGGGRDPIDSTVSGEGRNRILLYSLLAGAAFALAVGVKPVIAPLALPFLWGLRQYIKSAILFLVGLVSTLGLLYLPFMLMQGGIAGMLDTMATFLNHWAFNSSLHGGIGFIFGHRKVADILLGIALLAVLLYITFSLTKPGPWVQPPPVSHLHPDPWQCAFTYLFASLLLSSTVHPWYLLWALALLPICFHPAMWIFSGTICLSYIALTDLQRFHIPIVISLAEYLPVYATLIGWAWYRHGQSTQFSKPPSPSG